VQLHHSVQDGGPRFRRRAPELDLAGQQWHFAVTGDEPPGDRPNRYR
jgi:hypothetical protein